jgi:transposase
MYHHSMTQVLTISCKLKVSNSQAAKLDATLDAFVQALNWVNQNTPEKILNALKLQSLGYRDIRARFGLSNNLAQQVCRWVVSARKTASQKKPSGQSLQGGLRDLRCPHLLLPSERLDSIAHHR